MGKTIAGAVTIVVGVLLVGLAIGVWLPDIYFDGPRTLASARTASGHAFEVTQWWNHIDFYSTHLYVTYPDGHVDETVLDGDDCKSWGIPMTVDEMAHTVTVVLCGARTRQVEW